MAIIGLFVTFLKFFKCFKVALYFVFLVVLLLKAPIAIYNILYICISTNNEKTKTEIIRINILLVTDANIALPVQALHGIGLSALLTVGVIYIDSILPKTLRASGQAIYSTSLYGLGPSIGLFMAGLLMSSGSTQTLWIMCLFVSVIGCIIVNRAMQIDDQQTIANHKL